ncbi:MAG: FkbM family methyltransferase [Puniceicoccales bacterium]|nr:FkbM family methyltransferase [Puniceicoccales bacterium]
MEGILRPLVQNFDSPLFKERYLKLLRGLDSDSILTVHKILSRLQRAIAGELILTDAHEEKILAKITVNMQNNIIKAGDCFACMGYFLPINSFEPSIFYHKLHMNTLATLDKIASKCILDIGAYVGDSALILSPYTREKVFSFEPVPTLYELLLKTIEMNDLQNVVPVNIGLGDRNETRNAYLQGPGSSFVRHIDLTCSISDSVQVTTVDTFVEKNNLQIGLIKADIEGFEQYMLRGAEKTIKSQKPTLMICIYHNESDFFDIKPLLESWNLGYKFRIVKAIDGNVFSETMLIAEMV